MKLKQNLHWFLYPLFVLACAQQTSPTGGPKDTIPPILETSLPKKEQTNFNGSKIELDFNEMVIVNNAKEQLLVTPDIGKKYEIVAKKKKVTIVLDEKLKDSTTYTFNFRDAIQDITEKNSAENLKLAFSTGPYIDSLSIRGFAKDILKNKELKDATVALYQSDTFNIFKHKPIYITKTDKDGGFEIENLKPGYYQIYAFEDKSRNLIVDSRNEMYGFLSDSLHLTKNIEDLSIPLIRLDARDLRLTSARPYNTYFNFKTSKGLFDYRIQSFNNDSIISSYAEDRSNIRIYNTFPENDSTQVRFVGIDSIQNKIDTTLYIKFSTRQNTPERFDVKFENFKVFQNKGTLSGTVSFTKPLLLINYDSISYQIDSLTIIPFAKEDFKWNTQTKSLHVEKKIDPSLLKKEPLKEPPTQSTAAPSKEPKPQPITNLLRFGYGSLISIERDSSAIAEQTLKPMKLEDTGIIFIEVKTSEPYYIIELLDKSFNILRTEKNSKAITFDNLQPGDYQIRMTIDKNNDGKWSSGNFYKMIEPEKMIYYKNEKDLPIINLKANWELGPLLITY